MASNETSMWIHFLKLPKPSKSSKYHSAVRNYCQETLVCSNETRLSDHIISKCKAAPASDKLLRPLSNSAVGTSAPSLSSDIPSSATFLVTSSSFPTQLPKTNICCNELDDVFDDSDVEKYDVDQDISGKCIPCIRT